MSFGRSERDSLVSGSDIVFTIVMLLMVAVAPVIIGAQREQAQQRDDLVDIRVSLPDALVPFLEQGGRARPPDSLTQEQMLLLKIDERSTVTSYILEKGRDSDSTKSKASEFWSSSSKDTLLYVPSGASGLAYSRRIRNRLDTLIVMGLTAVPVVMAVDAGAKPYVILWSIAHMARMTKDAKTDRSVPAVSNISFLTRRREGEQP